MNTEEYNIAIYKDSKGALTPINFSNLPFEPKRLFYITDVPKGDIRGQHAHYTTQHYLLCITGKIKLTLFDGKETKEIILTPGTSVFVDKLIWDTQTYLTDNAILLVIASTDYSESDYIRDLDKFMKAATRY